MLIPIQGIEGLEFIPAELIYNVCQTKDGFTTIWFLLEGGSRHYIKTTETVSEIGQRVNQALVNFALLQHSNNPYR